MLAVHPIVITTSHPPAICSRTAAGRAMATEGHPLSPPAKNGGTTSGPSSSKIKSIARVKRRGGAPIGNQNAFKHGRYSARFLARRAELRLLRRETRAVIAQINTFRALRRVLGLPRRASHYAFAKKHPDGRCSVTVKTVRFGYDGRKMTPAQCAHAKKMKPVWRELMSQPATIAFETLQMLATPWWGAT